MIEIIEPAAWMFSGLCLYTCLNHGYRAFLGSKRGAHVAFSAMSLVGIFYAQMSLHIYRTSSIPEWIWWSIVQYALAAVVLALLALFASYYAEIQERRGLWIVIALHVVSAMLVFWAGGQAVAPALAHLNEVRLPWGEIVFVPGESLNKWLPVLEFPTYATFAYMIYACVQLKRHGERRAARAFGIAVAIVFACVFSADLNSYLHFSTFLFPEFGFVALMLIMSLNLSTNLVEAHYQKFVAESTAICLLAFDPPIPLELTDPGEVWLALNSGYAIECNAAFARMRGGTIREILGRRAEEFRMDSEPGDRSYITDLVQARYRIRNLETRGRDLAGNPLFFVTDFYGDYENGGMVRLWLSQQDITATKHAEGAARLSNERYARLCEATFEGIAISHEGKIIDANEQLARMLGYELPELIGMSPMNLASSDSVGEVEQNVRTGSEGSYEHSARRKDGSAFPVEIRARMMRADNELWRVSAVRDISARVAAQKALRESAERFRLVAEQTGQVIYEYDVTAGRIVQWAGAIREVTGYSPEEFGRFTMRDIQEHVNPSDRAYVSRHLERALVMRRPFQIEYRLCTKNGNDVIIEDRGVFLKDDSGSITRLIGSMNDITSRRKAEDAVKAIARGVSGTIGEAFFRTLVESLCSVLEANSVFVAEILPEHHRAQTIAAWTNKGQAENFSYDLAGTPCEAVADGRACTIPTGVISQFPDDAMLRESGADGYSGVPLLNAAGDVIGLMAVLFSDPISNPGLAESALQIFASRAAGEIERTRSEAQVLQLNTELEERVELRTRELSEVNRELESFSYSVSHDLRAPLRNISGFVELLKSNGARMDDESERYLGTITSEVRRMAALIDDLLELSRIGRTEMLFEAIDPGSIVDVVREAMVLETQNRTIEWEIGALPRVKADRSLLRQVFANLISNAVKYTKYREKAVIEVGYLNGNSTDREIVFYVRDNGVGFDMKYVGKLFGVFQRLHSARQFEGTGIGLANVQRIIHRHGGRIWAEAALDQGATFFFSLPS